VGARIINAPAVATFVLLTLITGDAHDEIRTERAKRWSSLLRARTQTQFAAPQRPIMTLCVWVQAERASHRERHATRFSLWWAPFDLLMGCRVITIRPRSHNSLCYPVTGRLAEKRPVCPPDNWLTSFGTLIKWHEEDTAPIFPLNRLSSDQTTLSDRGGWLGKSMKDSLTKQLACCLVE
jgi:hypothetical protein